MSASNALHWIEVWEYCLKMARRTFPFDPDAADDAATDCFDRFVRIYGQTGLKNYQPWVGRSIACLKKNVLRERARFWIAANEEEGEVIERLRPVAPTQEARIDAKRWLQRIDQLDGAERSAFAILAEGGNVKDVMDEHNLGPREALNLIAAARRQLHK